MSIEENVGKITKRLLIDQPFYGLFLLTLNKVYRKDIPTACVSKNGINCQLAINPEFWESLETDIFRQSILLHETLHICFGHLDLWSIFEDKEIANIAADCEVNQYIGKDKLPEGCIWLDDLNAKFGLKMGVKQGTHYYYKELTKMSPKKQQQLKESCGMRGEKVGDMHKLWKEFQNLSPAEKQLIQKQVEYQLKEVAEQVQKSRGTIPSEMSQIIDDLFKVEPAVFNWKAQLRRFIGNSQEVYTKSSRKKFNKRFPDNPALKIRFKKHLLCCMDTSGSVSQDELREFLNEIYHIKKSGVAVTVMECDAQINKIYKMKKYPEVEVKGRGGTFAEPALKYYNEHRNIYSGFIYFTDGYIESSPLKTFKKMLWVVTSNGADIVNNDWPWYKMKIPAGG